MNRRLGKRDVWKSSKLSNSVFWVIGGGCALLAALAWFTSPTVHAQSSSLGGPLPSLTSDQSTLFNKGLSVFNTKWDPFRGLGPVYTEAACFTCHGGGVSSPAGIPGQSSAERGSRYGKWNPDGTFNYLDGTGTFPENEGGPVLHQQTVAQFVNHMSHCHVPGEVVPSDATVVNQIRSPQLFGLGLIDSIPESAILANAVDRGLGIKGVPNMVPDQFGNLHVGRFGQKANVPNLLFFTASAMFDELGITTPIFLNEHLPQGIGPIPLACESISKSPQDTDGANTVSIYQFESFLAPNTQLALTPAAQVGQALFQSIGCNLCHVEHMQTDPNATVFTDLNGGNLGPVAALGNQTVSLYSDLLLHDVGPGLSGGVPLGQATLTQWRTTPLWGLSSRRTFGFLHDGRTTSVDQAIRAHGGEASQVLTNYSGLSAINRSNLLAFLNSL
jgi:CxxC motif-containing protein (DUF1111 family)